MNFLNFFLPWGGYKNTQIPFGADTISGAKRREEEEAITFLQCLFSEDRVKQQDNIHYPFKEKDLQKAKEMCELLGPQCRIEGEEGPTISETLKKIIDRSYAQKQEAAELLKELFSLHTTKKHSQNTPPLVEKDFQKAQEMASRLGLQYSIQINKKDTLTVAEILNKIQAGLTTGAQKPYNHTSVLETFQETYENPLPSKYSELFNLLDEDLSDKEKRKKIYDKFEKDPSALWVCISHPILKCKSSKSQVTPLYLLQKYIFEDADAWETIFKLALGHSETIGLRYVEAILLPIMQEALSLNFESPHLKSLVDKEKERLASFESTGTEEQLQLEAHQHLMESIVLTKKKKGAKQCPKIIKALLNTPDLMSNYALAECQVPYTPIISLDMMDMDDQLSYTPGELDLEKRKQQAANDKEAWRTKSLKALAIAIREREELMDKQAALIKKHPWLLSHKIEIPQLKPKEILGILKDIIEVSADVAMPYNTLWAQENLDIHIQNVCVNLLLRFSDKINTLTDCLPHSELSFVHNAASRGDEAVAIIKAISLEPKLHFLFQKFCDHRGKDGSPLEIALKAGGSIAIRNIFQKHTESPAIWKSLFKSEYHENIHSKEDALKLIQQKEAYKLLHPAYRLLDSNYHAAEFKIKKQVNLPSTGSYESSYNDRWKRLIATLKEPEDIVLQQVLADHLEYLEYLLKLAHTGRSIQDRFFILRLKNVRNAIIDVISTPSKLHKIQNSPEIHPTICWWMTFLPKTAEPIPVSIDGRPIKKAGSLGFLGSKSPASQFKNNTPNSLVGALSKMRNPEKQPVMRFEEKVKQAIASLMEDMLQDHRLPASFSTDLDTPVKPIL